MLVSTKTKTIVAATLLAFSAVTLQTQPVRAQKVEATLATVNAAAFLIPRMEVLFAKKVAEKTNGNFVIKVVTDGQLGGMKENVEAVMAGNLEMAQVNNAFLGSLHSPTMAFDLPFIFRDNGHMRLVVRGAIGQKIYSDFEKRTGVRLMMTGLADGPRSVFNRTRPVNTPADLKGMKLRVMENPIMVDTFRALGAIPTPMAFPEIYMAAKQGVIDGAETPPTGLIDMKAPEISKYYSLTRHFAMPSAVAVNAKWFDKLSDENKKAFREAEAEAVAWYDKVYDEESEKALEIVKKDGMIINAVTDPSEFRNAVKSVYEKYAERAGGQAVLDQIIATK